ncbi:DUF4157 domain-containing protein [bacterium]|nr:DUF4157 domain-containing protein [bacterium]
MASNQKTQQTKKVQQNTKAQKPKEHKNQLLNAAQVRSAPETLRGEDVLKAQQQLGNETVQRSLDSARQEAAAADEQGNLNPEISQAIQNKRGAGSALPASIKEEGKKTLGQDFDDVRIHTDEGANQISQKINAKAFTIGKDIFFKKGTFAPGSAKGRETLLHELTHVVQQSGAAPAGGKLKLGAPNTTHEKEAETLSKKNNQTAASVSGNANGAIVQRKKETEEEIELKNKEQRGKMRKMAGIKLPGYSTGENMKGTHQIIETQKAKQGITPDALMAQRKKMGIGKKENTKNLEKLDAKQDSEQKHVRESEYMEGKYTKDVGKGRLISTIQSTNSSEEEVAKAKQQLEDVHGSKSNSFKKIFGKDQGSKAMKQREQALKAAAQRGDEGAYEKYKAYKDANPSTGSKIGGFFKKTFTKDNMMKGFSTVKGLLGGGGEEKKEETPAPAQQQAMAGGMGGGGGMGTIMQEYARVLEENKRLQEKLNEKGEK